MPADPSARPATLPRRFPALLAASATLQIMLLTMLLAISLAATATAQPAEESKDKPGDAPAAAPMDGPPQGPPPALVRFGQVEQQTLQDQWPVIGRLREVRRATVATEVFGRIIAMPVDEGTRVEGGKTIIAKVDPVWTDTAVESAQAALAQAGATVLQVEAQADQSARDLAMLEELAAAQSAKPREVDDARSKAASDKAGVQAARAGVEAAATALQRAKVEQTRQNVVAPFDGVVIKKLVEVGQWANQGTPVAEVISAGTIDAEIDVPEQLVNNLSVGDDVEVVVEPVKQEFTGKIRAIIPAGGNAARTFPVRVTLDDQGGKLKPGMSVVARVPTGQRKEVLTVPRDAVMRGQGGLAMVWVSAGGMALPVGVDVLFGSGDIYAVKVSAANAGPPLAPGMQVVIEGAERLFPTRPLMTSEPMPAQSGGPPSQPPAADDKAPTSDQAAATPQQ